MSAQTASLNSEDVSEKAYWLGSLWLGSFDRRRRAVPVSSDELIVPGCTAAPNNFVAGYLV